MKTQTDQLVAVRRSDNSMRVARLMKPDRRYLSHQQQHQGYILVKTGGGRLARVHSHRSVWPLPKDESLRIGDRIHHVVEKKRARKRMGGDEDITNAPWDTHDWAYPTPSTRRMSVVRNFRPSRYHRQQTTDAPWPTTEQELLHERRVARRNLLRLIDTQRSHSSQTSRRKTGMARPHAGGVQVQPESKPPSCTAKVDDYIGVVRPSTNKHVWAKVLSPDEETLPSQVLVDFRSSKGPYRVDIGTTVLKSKPAYESFVEQRGDPVGFRHVFGCTLSGYASTP